METRLLLILLCIAAVANSSVLRTCAQQGFISIDCGLPGNTTYVEDNTNILYAPDAGFVDSGTNYNIATQYMLPLLSRRYRTVRSFPEGPRNCYTIRPVVPGSKYLIRAAFMYGNYDGLNKPPAFKLHLGVNFWDRVNVSDPNIALLKEIVVFVLEDFVQVCLVNIGSGTPFISALDLRPLKNTLYPQVNATRGLALFARINFGASSDNTAAYFPSDQTVYSSSSLQSGQASAIIRYPDDPYDRIWIGYTDDSTWTIMSTTSMVQNIRNDMFAVPSKVMQTAITPRNASQGISFYWEAETQPDDPVPGYISIMYFSELQNLSSSDLREFYVFLNDILWYRKAFKPDYLYADAIFAINPYRTIRYNVKISASPNSTLPPIINALEVFSFRSFDEVGTDAQDVSAINAIRAKYQVKKNWMGDPCGPKNLIWDGLSCSYDISSYPRITTLNLSSCGLTGDISPSFADLKAVKNLYLSDNSLTGPIPDVLSQLPSLATLDLTGNQLSGSIPSGLLKRFHDGSLDLRYGNNPNLCANGTSCLHTSRRSNLVIYVAVPVVVVVLVIVFVLAICFLRVKRKGSIIRPQNGHSSVVLESRRFTYQELQTITNKFQRVLGRGGFGYVYDGFLEDGTQVAVKLRSHSSYQGAKEFLAEAQILTRIHHKNLVSMIGYCKDGEYMALVYEYMSEGTLQEHIVAGKNLTWRQRLRIALESAQGLEYLHKGCNPPLIHRDVKASNILLNTKMEARIADFGLSKAFSCDNDTHISTNTLVGTPGYVDPEYQATLQPTTKSDVYSFGVVLLELVTGRPAILQDPTPTSIIQWVRLRLASGNIEDVMDPHMDGDYDVNSVWKMADIALKCTAQASTQRPTMTEVVGQLQECHELEAARSGTGEPNSSSEPYSDYNMKAACGFSTDVSQTSTASGMGHNFGRMPTMATGPDAR